MNICSRFAMTAISAAALMLYAQGARGQGLEEKISVTFSGPVEVPGEVLPAGTYVFEALKDGSLTRILSADERVVYATLMTVPSEQLEPAEKATVLLRKHEEGIPQRVDAWFFPGDSIGNEFVYPKAHATKAHGAVSEGAKDVAVSSEFVAVHAAHISAHVGAAVYHAGKFVVG